MSIKHTCSTRSLIFYFLIIFFIMLPANVTAESASLPLCPEISAQSAIVIEANSGRVLYEKQARMKAYPASITKIMTGLLALERINPESKIRIPAEAVGIEGSSIYLAPNEIISLRDLVYGLMLRSGNDAAVAIGKAVAGDTDNFVLLMNRRALLLGAADTNFMNPNGLFNKEHYTTCYDMALIAREAMKNEEFRKIAAAKNWTADRGTGKHNQFYNKNKVVFEYEGGNGIKIGYTSASGRTLVASSMRNGMELICVVMRAPDWFNDSYKLMDYVHDNYEMKKIACGGRILKAVPLTKSGRDHVFVGPQNDIAFPVIKGEKSSTSICYRLPETATAPIDRWQEAGKLSIYDRDEHIYDQPLYYLEDMDCVK